MFCNFSNPCCNFCQPCGIPSCFGVASVMKNEALLANNALLQVMYHDRFQKEKLCGDKNKSSKSLIKISSSADQKQKSVKVKKDSKSGKPAKSKQSKPCCCTPGQAGGGKPAQRKSLQAMFDACKSGNGPSDAQAGRPRPLTQQQSNSCVPCNCNSLNDQMQKIYPQSLAMQPMPSKFSQMDSGECPPCICESNPTQMGRTRFSSQTNSNYNVGYIMHEDDQLDLDDSKCCNDNSNDNCCTCDDGDDLDPCDNSDTCNNCDTNMDDANNKANSFKIFSCCRCETNNAVLQKSQSYSNETRSKPKRPAADRNENSRRSNTADGKETSRRSGTNDGRDGPRRPSTAKDSPRRVPSTNKSTTRRDPDYDNCCPDNDKPKSKPARPIGKTPSQRGGGGPETKKPTSRPKPTTANNKSSKPKTRVKASESADNKATASRDDFLECTCNDDKEVVNVDLCSDASSDNDDAGGPMDCETCLNMIQSCMKKTVRQVLEECVCNNLCNIASHMKKLECQSAKNEEILSKGFSCLAEKMCQQQKAMECQLRMLAEQCGGNSPMGNNNNMNNNMNGNSSNCNNGAGNNRNPGVDTGKLGCNCPRAPPEQGCCYCGRNAPPGANNGGGSIRGNGSNMGGNQNRGPPNNLSNNASGYCYCGTENGLEEQGFSETGYAEGSNYAGFEGSPGARESAGYSGMDSSCDSDFCQNLLAPSNRKKQKYDKKQDVKVCLIPQICTNSPFQKYSNNVNGRSYQNSLKCYGASQPILKRTTSAIQNRSLMSCSCQMNNLSKVKSSSGRNQYYDMFDQSNVGQYTRNTLQKCKCLGYSKPVQGAFNINDSCSDMGTGASQSLSPQSSIVSGSDCNCF